MQDRLDPALERHIVAATDAILAEQQPDGHWVYELEADATIPAEYVLMVHYFAETPDLELERKIGVYLRRIQGAHGGWPLFHDGAFDMSASVKAYFALKMIGDDINADHMRRAREAILSRGGAVKSNVFTRALLSLYGVIRWNSVPVMPVEIMLLPKWFPFHIDKISYWARTVIVPLLVLQALKPKAINPRGVTIDELFHEDPRTVGAPHKAPHQKWSWFLGFRAIDIVLRALEPVMPKGLRKRAIDRCVAWVTERLNGIDGLGAIYPAMENAVKMYAVLGYPPEHPDRKIARASLDKLLVVKEHEAYCQPCVSPVWDTSLVAHALLEAGGEKATAAANRGLDWLKPLQILDVKGDWIEQRPNVRPGGWAFQYNNAHYPDLDDTAVVAMAMDRARGERGATFDSVDRPRARMDRRAAVPGRRLRRVRRRQRLSLPQQHPVRRPRRAARSADRGPDRALPLAAGAARRARRNLRADAPRDRMDPARPVTRGKLVRPLGHELHLRHLVGAVRAQRRGRRSQRPDGAQGGELARLDPERRRRLGRGRGELQARLQGLRSGTQHRLANGMGLAWLDGGRRGGACGCWTRHRVSCAETRL